MSSVEDGELLERCSCQDEYANCECGTRRHKNDICSHGIADGVCCECKECHSELGLVCPYCERNEKECEEQTENEKNPITDWCGWGLSCDDCYYKNQPESDEEDEDEEDEVIKSFYICRECGASYSNCEVDCFECDGQMCCYLFQAETFEEARKIADKQFEEEDYKLDNECEKIYKCVTCSQMKRLDDIVCIKLKPKRVWKCCDCIDLCEYCDKPTENGPWTQSKKCDCVQCDCGTLVLADEWDEKMECCQECFNK